MNPFQNLIVDCLINTKHVESAAVLVAHSGSVAAASPGLRVRPRDAQALTGAFRRLAAVRERGLERGLSGSFSFQEEGFGCVRADRISIYCKRGGRGLLLVRTGLFIIAATYSEDMLPGVCVEAVEALAEYLRQKGK
ncbi:profilin-4 isoform X1 [Pygocentrus nattereri]|uniref:Profilin n=1 Tax=Pygocentrus nattereri TaxID=42514 RepID=A0A3B4DAE3_PYGNA|nr:profilin-4 isoform X1 [Pygocentrus nattereri]